MNHNQPQYSRVKRPVQAAGRFYSRLAPVYDWLAASEAHLMDAGLQMLDPDQGESLLEIGSGTGRALLQAAGEESPDLIAGLDLSWGMCQRAQRKLEHNQAQEQVDMIQGSALDLPFAEESFQSVFCSFTLELFDTPDLPVVLAEIRRVLTPGGRLGLVALSRDRPLPWVGRLYEQLHLWFPTWIDCRPIPVQSLLKKAGFSIQQVERRAMWGLPVSLVLSTLQRNHQQCFSAPQPGRV